MYFMIFFQLQMFGLCDLNNISVTINRSRDYKMEAFPMTLVYYCWERQVHICRPLDILLYAFFPIFFFMHFTQYLSLDVNLCFRIIMPPIWCSYFDKLCIYFLIIYYCLCIETTADVLLA